MPPRSAALRATYFLPAFFNVCIMKNRLQLILLQLFIFGALGNAFSQSSRIVNAADFGAATSGADATYAVRLALEHCKKTKATKLVFPKGRYEFYPDKAVEKYFFISNNDEGLKRIVFPVFDFNNFEIDGQGSEFIFHGFTCPFIIENSRNISIKNLSINYVRTFHNEGNIVAVGDWGFDVSFREEFPYKIESGSLQFIGEGNKYPYSNLLEFDPVKKETAFMAKDYWLWSPLQAEQLPNKVVRIYKKGVAATVGNVMVFGAANRSVPGFTLTDSRNISITGVNIFHCGGMGVIAQRCADIMLDGVNVTMPPNSKRVVSITADATHFVNCSGKITMTNCLFENQKDDATNIHGVYAGVSRIISPTELEIKIENDGQYGFDFLEAGKKVELVTAASLVTLGENEVKSSKRLNKEYTIITLRKPIPDGLKVKDVIGSAEEKVEVLISYCRIQSNRARGLLIGSRGKTIIENNYFHVPGAAILFEGDGSYWYEQSGVNDCTIRNNIFENGNFGVWGNAVIQVGAGIKKEQRAGSRYNKNILIEHNTFRVFDPRILNIYSVDNLVFRNNKIEKTEAYPKLQDNAKPFVVEYSSNVTIEE